MLVIGRLARYARGVMHIQAERRTAGQLAGVGVAGVSGWLGAPILMLMVLALVNGCASTGATRQADQVGAGIAEYRQLVLKVRAALSATLQALDGVVVGADGDLGAAFKRFDEALHRLEVDSIQARARAEAMRTRGDAYFDEWEEQLASAPDEQSRQAVVQRRTELRRCFDEIRRSSLQVREEFKPFLSNLRDLRIVLGNDLSLAGIDAAKALILKTKADGRRVGQALDGVVAELNSVAAATEPVRTSKQSGGRE